MKELKTIHKGNQMQILHSEQTTQLIASLVAENGLEIAMIEKKLTISDSINYGTSLKTLERKMDFKNLTKVLCFVIMRTSTFFNVSKPLNESQSVMLAMDLLDVFGHETIEDILLMFKYARQGKFSKSYSRIDSETVFSGWMPEYLELKAIERERIHVEKKKEKESQVRFDLKNVDPKILEVFKRIGVEKKIKETKPKTIFNSQAMFLEQLKEEVKTWDNKKLKDSLDEFVKDPVRNKEIINVLKIKLESKKIK